eukprot:m.145524 g.145524  ORF g.145524 m.145524 type:complete len:55 (+) comp24279_c0_seq6:327-491(+)
MPALMTTFMGSASINMATLIRKPNILISSLVLSTGNRMVAKSVYLGFSGQKTIN